MTKTLVKKCPLLLAVKTKEQRKPVEKKAMLPVELAIIAENDDVSAFLIRAMWLERYKVNIWFTFVKHNYYFAICSMLPQCQIMLWNNFDY